MSKSREFTIKYFKAILAKTNLNDLALDYKLLEFATGP